jgi:hypothetical protein
MTFALLETLRDQQLGSTEDRNRVITSLWFEQARGRTISLAKSLGIQQTPQRLGQNPFTTGLMTDESRSLIQLPKPKPVICAIALVLEDGSPAEIFNNGLRESLTNNLNSHGSLAYVASDAAPTAYRVYGRYAESGSKITISIVLQLGLGSKAKKYTLPAIITAKDEQFSNAIRAIENYLSNSTKSQ